MKADKTWWGLALVGILVAGYVVTDTLTFAFKTLTRPAAPIAEVVEKSEPAAVLGEETVNLSSYQAVHLTNGQIYFGQLSDEGNQFANLKKVYYYQKSGEEWQLTALSDELKINRDHILYFEPLKADSDTVKAIESYEQGQ
ncbi:MAG: hypothetical protein NTZ93_00075 [Candidatus Beckwithbacteria bacterium]|nr:hypothetical protein [Candidatus Beckwithbacteria bacterium]